MSPAPERFTGLRAAPRVTVEARITRLRQQIASERVRTRVVAWALEPRIRRVERVFMQLRGLPRYAARIAPYALPVAGLVFRRSRAIKLALRVWGAVRLAKSVARAVISNRRREVVAVHRAPHGATGESQ